jgi:hypothetical protein
VTQSVSTTPGVRRFAPRIAGALAIVGLAVLVLNVAGIGG